MVGIVIFSAVQPVTRLRRVSEMTSRINQAIAKQQRMEAISAARVRARPHAPAGWGGVKAVWGGAQCRLQVATQAGGPPATPPDAAEPRLPRNPSVFKTGVA